MHLSRIELAQTMDKSKRSLLLNLANGKHYYSTVLGTECFQSRPLNTGLHWNCINICIISVTKRKVQLLMVIHPTWNIQLAHFSPVFIPNHLHKLQYNDIIIFELL
jgi:hypothetical protein